MDSFHWHLDELERLLSDDDKKKRRIRQSVLCYAAYCGSTLVVEALVEKGVGKEYYNVNRIITVETGPILVTKVKPSFIRTITLKVLYC